MVAFLCGALPLLVLKIDAELPDVFGMLTVSNAVRPTITILSTSVSFAPLFSGNMAALPSSIGNIFWGKASRSIMSPTQHRCGNGAVDPSLEFLGVSNVRPLEPEDELFQDPLGCIAGCKVGLEQFGAEDEPVVGWMVGVILSRFFGVERSCTLAHGAACSSLGVEGGVIRAFFRGEPTFRSIMAAGPLLLDILLPSSMLWLRCCRLLTGVNAT